MDQLAHTFKNMFDQFYEAPIEAWEDFASLGQVVNHPKDTVLKAQGDRETHMHFLLKGSAGVFVWKENNWACLDFAFQHHFFSDYMSILTGDPTPIQTILLEDSTLFTMKRSDYIDLSRTETGSVITKFSAEYSYVAKQQQQIDLLTKTAEQRYLDLLDREPDIINKVAQKHLASYLGITPQSFSRIRRSILEEDRKLP